ncbi:Miy3p NDAI_0I01180 [Naumovozyma dairenensis CBS 421]|uniref:MINDY deubiquitinase domain-containing protein n=1 Tax=Naumovozyma dairenensis (strain ATCC 10597 / BCRC 20456 / CBS 421 / NBRC 0211 / NRRL Y-12639) TaxID=1071378 RepID=G0WFX6_NAUDC|nr:hypothetical protein NDAI_0I01180 [Naumovozyma dairenensis CBS 421]CCD26687.1 hypothetical protein NDAI_0I01180 [Naumovozyma dairenensis CBS 421]
MNQVYQTKNVEINGSAYKILLQNTSAATDNNGNNGNNEGGNALIALCNVLLLSASHSTMARDLIQLVGRNNEVTLNDLVYVLSSAANQNRNTNTSSSSLIDINQLLQYLPQMADGLTVNPGFNGTFEEGIEMALFRLFNVGIVHGWIIDGENDPAAYNHVAKYTYESAQRMLVQSYDIKKNNLNVENSQEILEDAQYVKAFLARSATQLTEYGLRHLRELLVEKSYAVLFRNDTFVTIYKNNGELYMLETDPTYKNDRDIIWKSLRSVNGSQDNYYTGSFILASLERTNTYNQGHTAMPATAQHPRNGPMHSIVSNPFSDDNQDRPNGMQQTETNLDSVQQMETDEELARRLQEEEDREAAGDIQGAYSSLAARNRRNNNNNDNNNNGNNKEEDRKNKRHSIFGSNKKSNNGKTRKRDKVKKNCIIM